MKNLTKFSDGELIDLLIKILKELERRGKDLFKMIGSEYNMIKDLGLKIFKKKEEWNG